MLNPDSIIPMYEQLAKKLGNEIVSGKYEPGEKIPGEQAIADECGLSRVTVRHAISLLIERGLVESKQGKGTFVCSVPSLTDSKVINASFSLMALREKRFPDTKVLSSEIKVCTQELASRSGLNEKELISCVVRARYMDKKPAVLEYDYFPAALAGIANEELEKTSLIQLLESKYNLIPASYTTKFSSILAEGKKAEILGVNEGSPLLCVYETVLDRSGNVIYHNDQFINQSVYEYSITYDSN